MAEGRWLRIDPERYDELHEIGMFYRDLGLNIFVSPSDIPDGVRGGVRRGAQEVRNRIQVYGSRGIRD